MSYSKTFFYTGAVVSYTVETTGEYDIVAYGGSGGNTIVENGAGNGGNGAEIGGEFMLTAGEVLKIIVGGAGKSSEYGGGGGGGSFVYEASTGTALVIAGGGGGFGVLAGVGAGRIGSSGGAGYGEDPAPGGAGGLGGSGSSSHLYAGGGGAGFIGNGGSSYFAGGGTARGAGGTNAVGLGNGGFGGGGAAAYGGGGGGGSGYSGGGGGVYSGGGGGGSFDSGTNQKLIPGENTGNGFVVLEAVCYLRGTHILTPQGEVLVENLQIGDTVVTRFSGLQTIRWIGRQSFESRFVTSNLEKLPVCIHADALGDGLPTRDLFVSPGHAVLAGDQLVLAESLVNGVTITQDCAPTEIHYYHIELDHHDCVVAEGIWAETYADTAGMRGRFHNAASFHAQHPAHETPDEPNLCAPRPQCGPALDAALRPIIARASAALHPGRLQGFIDRIKAPGVIEGWALDTAYPDMPVLLEVVLDGTMLGTVLACDPRHDLVAAGKGRGRCAFRFRIAEPLTAERLARIEVRRAGDYAALAWTSAESRHAA